MDSRVTYKRQRTTPMTMSRPVSRYERVCVACQYIDSERGKEHDATWRNETKERCSFVQFFQCNTVHIILVLKKGNQIEPICFRVDI